MIFSLTVSPRFQISHREEDLPVSFVNLVDRADIGVIESGSGLCFSNEALSVLFVFEDVGTQEFRCDLTLQLGVLGLVDDTHSAVADLGGDLVVRDGLVDHDTPSLS